MTRWHVLRMQIMLNIMLIDKNSLCLLTKRARAQPLFSLSWGHPLFPLSFGNRSPGHPLFPLSLGTFGNLWEPLGTFGNLLGTGHLFPLSLGTFGNLWELLGTFAGGSIVGAVCPNFLYSYRWFTIHVMLFTHFWCISKHHIFCRWTIFILSVYSR